MIHHGFTFILNNGFIWISLIGNLSNGWLRNFTSFINKLTKYESLTEGVQGVERNEKFCFLFCIYYWYVVTGWNEFCQRGVKVSRFKDRNARTWRSDQFAWPRIVRDSPVIDYLQSSFSIDNSYTHAHIVSTSMIPAKVFSREFIFSLLNNNPFNSFRLIDTIFPRSLSLSFSYSK